MTRRLARAMRRLADRIDREGAPKAIGWCFTFEEGIGMVFHEASRMGCPLWYLGDEAYQRAYTYSGRISGMTHSVPAHPRGGT